MQRSVIIAKCIYMHADSTHVYVVFDRSLKELSSKFVEIWNSYDFSIIGALINNTVIEFDLDDKDKLFENIKWEMWYKITPAPFYNSKIFDFLISDLYQEETVLLWQELGSLENPTLEQINIYIEELNNRT